MLSRKTLSAEHDELRELAAALLACVAAPHCDPSRLGKARWLLTRKLLAHLAKEDALLYPRLRAGRDPRAAEVATRFAAEMGALADRYRAYIAAWPAERIADDWIAFGAATRQILQQLLRRIGGEETMLYTLIEETPSHRTAA
ncbi:hypothetical protein SAQ01S_20190 [Sphingomonas aquatilis NBRC 16722]|uniref:Hemerythrin-like domain-containing protein n=2 Tax=Sphingomonas TaxID=13687 RepID=A0AAW3TT35_9SPHN|nr:hemerythrin domain-containing protein [Sphingomonas aquatilis]MBB3875856.1 hemerythrin-like domain-containing protein [Sphingomonas aquatilis]GEM72253.1 hypothetical protein SAQ01S_20190 [Sphingomonas aquatilis NBRC 16722]